jgi:hypothetical protein
MIFRKLGEWLYRWATKYYRQGNTRNGTPVDGYMCPICGSTEIIFRPETYRRRGNQNERYATIRCTYCKNYTTKIYEWRVKPCPSC